MGIPFEDNPIGNVMPGNPAQLDGKAFFAMLIADTD
jgi:hypothetical protein